MKILIVLFITICALPFFLFSGDSCKPLPYDKIVDDLIKKTSLKLEKKHQLQLVGVKEGMMGAVKFIGLRFQVYRELKKSEARSIVVDSIQELLSDINNDEKIRQYLEVYPFDLNHVDIMLFINTKDRGTFYHPNLTGVTASRGDIKYFTNDLQDKYKYKAEEVETFEDALKIVKGEKSPSPSEIK